MAQYTYTVVDSDSGIPIANANIKYDYNIHGGPLGIGGGSGNGQLHTGNDGRASFQISGFNSGGAFSYYITANKYHDQGGEFTEGEITGDIDRRIDLVSSSKPDPSGQGFWAWLQNALGAGQKGTNDFLSQYWWVFVLLAILIVVVIIAALKYGGKVGPKGVN